MAAWQLGVRPCLRTALLAATIVVGGVAIALADAGGTLTVDIRAQPLATALAAFAEHTGLQLIYLSEIVEGRASNGARAGLTHRQALAALLEGTGLDFEFLNARTVWVYARRPAAAGSSPGLPAQAASAVDGGRGEYQCMAQSKWDAASTPADAGPTTIGGHRSSSVTAVATNES